MVRKNALICLAFLLFCGLAFAETTYKMRYNPQTSKGDWVVDPSTLSNADMPAFVAGGGVNWGDVLMLDQNVYGPQTISGGVPLMTTAVDTYGSGDQLVNLSFVRSGEWMLPPVERWYDPTDGLPADPEVGDRYGSDATANGWTINYIYEWDGTEWVETIPEEGFMVWDLLDMVFMYFFSGGWGEVGSSSFVSLDQTVPQLFTAGDLTGTGLLRVDSGILGLDTSSYLTGVDGSLYYLASNPSSYTTLSEVEGEGYLTGVDGALYYQASNPSNYIATVSTGSGLTGSGTVASPLLVDDSIYQTSLDLVKGTYTDGKYCTYSSSGTVLNCTSEGGSGGGLSGLTSGRVQKASSSTMIVDSSIYDNASVVTVDGSLYMGSTLATYPLGNNSIHASGGLEVDGAVYGNTSLQIDGNIYFGGTALRSLGVNVASPSANFEIVGTASILKHTTGKVDDTVYIANSDVIITWYLSTTSAAYLLAGSSNPPTNPANWVAGANSQLGGTGVVLKGQYWKIDSSGNNNVTNIWEFPIGK